MPHLNHELFLQCLQITFIGNSSQNILTKDEYLNIKKILSILSIIHPKHMTILIQKWKVKLFELLNCFQNDFQNIDFFSENKKNLM